MKISFKIKAGEEGSGSLEDAARMASGAADEAMLQALKSAVCPEHGPCPGAHLEPTGAGPHAFKLAGACCAAFTREYQRQLVKAFEERGARTPGAVVSASPDRRVPVVVLALMILLVLAGVLIYMKAGR